MFFMVCECYKFGLYITTYFEYGQSFIREFLVLAFMECTGLKLLLLANVPDLEMKQFWSVNYICQVCKFKLLFWKCSKF